jgi:alanyl-tRNA synthetase
MLTSQDIRQRFLAFFEARGHVILPSAPLVPENDPSVLFNTAGMQPLVPYLLGEPHPAGVRLTNAQKCVRTQDIDEVGDKTHDTFFEMLGNWSLGDYFKEEAIRWSYTFLTSKDEGLGLDPGRLYITVFGGNSDAPRDDEAFKIWRSIGIPENRIYFLTTEPSGKEPNWWSPGDNGPCGPDSEMFYDVTPEGLGDMTLEEYKQADEAQAIVEIWNDVFMEYEKKEGKVIGKLAKQNVDTGGGLERMVMAVQRKDNIFDTDLFSHLMAALKGASSQENLRASRIVADHLRTAIFLVGDGVRPSNTDQGYILRRLLRRAVRYGDVLGIEPGSLSSLVGPALVPYRGVYESIFTQQTEIETVIRVEEEKFRQTLRKGLGELERRLSLGSLSGEDAFILFSTYGFPLEMTIEIAKERGIEVDEQAFRNAFKEHQDLSRTASAGKFKGGLADHSAKVTALHTATHLMLAGLRRELGNDVHQAGSNITEERTRFDFTWPEKVPRETLDRVEAYVNEAIGSGATVGTTIMEKDAAKAAGVEGSFWEKYPEKVTVYQVQGPDGTVYSQELCGGPHVATTADIAAFGHFRIIKEEASSAGVRRVKAILT